MKRYEALRIYQRSPEVAGFHPEDMFKVKCANCGRFFSMYRNHHTVKQGEIIEGIIQCECGQWHRFID